jgi:hypothetical protein
MDFLKKIFGGNTANVNSANQENFIVDETGNAKEASSVSSVKVSAPVPTPVSNSIPNTASAPTAPQNPVANTTQSEGEYVGDTSAFDELMKQAESSVDARVLEQPILDPEFQKAKDELESEGDIEIFPTE